MDTKPHLKTSQVDGFWIKRAENGILPDFVIRCGVCDVLRETANKDLQSGGYQYMSNQEFIDKVMRVEESINIHATEANE